MKRILPLLMCCLLLAGCTKAPLSPDDQATADLLTKTLPQEDYAVATVNGQDLMYSEYRTVESAYLYQAEAAGADLTDASAAAYFQDLALTYAIEQMLVRQDMAAQGCFDFDAETEAWFAAQGKAAYDTALQQVKDSLRGADAVEDELNDLALAYAASLNVTEQTYVDFYRSQYAAAKYYEWLTRDNPVTDEDVKAAYEARVEASKALYGDDAAAFERAAENGSETWYRPEGYRSILQILLPASGATAEEKLASVQATVDAIAVRLEQGESFQALMAEYSTDANGQNETFLQSGYQVHRDSIVWEQAFIDAAFSDEMAQPGDWSKPFASDLGVHILYCLSDSPGGAVPLTEELHDLLAYAIYTERYTAAQSARINALADAAEVVIH